MWVPFPLRCYLPQLLQTEVGLVLILPLNRHSKTYKYKGRPQHRIIEVYIQHSLDGHTLSRESESLVHNIYKHERIRKYLHFCWLAATVLGVRKLATPLW